MSTTIYDELKKLPLNYFFYFLLVVFIVVRSMLFVYSKLFSGRHRNGLINIPNGPVDTLNDSIIIPGELRWLEAPGTIVTRHTRSGRIYGTYQLAPNQ